MNKLMIRVAALFFLLMVSQSVYARGWVGARSPCAKGGHEVSPGSGMGMDCEWRHSAGAYYGVNQRVEIRPNMFTEGDDQAYVPLSGLFELKMYWCPLPENMDTCSRANGTLLLSGGVVKLNSSIPLKKQDIVKRFAGNRSPSAGGYCITLSDVNTGYEYRGNLGYGPDGRGIFCGDVYKLPMEPPKCLLNNGADLDVLLGKLERNNIAVKAGSSVQSVSKDISINCSGSMAYNANMELKYTPLIVGGEEIISTTTKGLGIAVIYSGNVVRPGKSYPLSYQLGIHTLKLGFEAVRDPAVAATDLKTGDFTANAVLVFTEQ